MTRRMSMAGRKKDPSRIRTAAAFSLLAGATLLLTACGGSGLDGEYIQRDGSSLQTVTIDGTEATYTSIDCTGKENTRYSNGASAGELTDDESAIVWGDTGRFQENTPITVTESALDIEGYDTFVLKDSDAGDALMAEYDDQKDSYGLDCQ